MMLYKMFLSMALIGMADHVGADDIGITMYEEDGNHNTTEIIGGVELSKEERNKRPFLVNVGITDGGTDRFLCGGSLISPHAVLTAAHCLYDPFTLAFRPPEWVDFYRWSTQDTNVVRQFILPNNAIHHPRYSATNFDNDAALLILTGTAPAEITLTLNSDEAVPASTGVPLDVAGWGLMDGGLQTNTPRVATLNYVSNFDCARNPYQYGVAQITDSMMCASAYQKDSCAGDSGSPLVLGTGGEYGGILDPVTQVGIVSWGTGCAQPGFPGVYVRVSDVWRWITDTVFQRTGELLKRPSPITTTSKRKKKKKGGLRS